MPQAKMISPNNVGSRNSQIGSGFAIKKRRPLIG
jgi:hypothetical protein